MKGFLVLIISLLAFSSNSLAIGPIPIKPWNDFIQPAMFSQLNGTAVNRCTGAIIKFSNSSPEQKALYLTNGHCIKLIHPDNPIENEEYIIPLMAYGNKGSQKIETEKILFATMNKTDIAIVQLKNTYQELKEKIDLDPFVVSETRLEAGQTVALPNAYYGKLLACKIEKNVYQLKESHWTWEDSLRYEFCPTEPGWSGTALVDEDLIGKRVLYGIHNTGANVANPCQMNAPCELSEDGSVDFFLGKKYAQQTYMINDCVNDLGEFDPLISTCNL